MHSCVKTTVFPYCIDVSLTKISLALVRERTIPTERLPIVGKVSANFLEIEGSHVVRATDPYGRNLDFLDRSRYFFLQVVPEL
jgi:hypothetical protein